MYSIVISLLLGILTLACLGVSILVVKILIELVMGTPPFVPVRDRALPEIYNLFQTLKPITAQSTVVDPGCGNGKVLVYLAQHSPMAHYIGIERSTIPYLLAKWNTRLLPQVTIVYGDIFTFSYANTTHLFTYLFGHTLDKLDTVIHPQVVAGTILVSCDFTLSSRKPVLEKNIPHHEHDPGLTKKLYAYRY